MNNQTEKRLLRILNHAYNEIPYFNNVINDLIDDTEEIAPELFARLPLFNKQTIRDVGWVNFVSPRYLNDSYMPDVAKGARTERTSGTTGNPMQILWDQNDYFSSTMNHWKYRNQFFGIMPASRVCASAKTTPGNMLYYIKGNKLTFCIKRMNWETVPQIIEAINEFQPEWLYLQNSILYILIYVANKLGMKLPDSIRYIEYLGEPICSYYREQIEKMLTVPTSNMYGCVETNGISYECRCGQNHIIPENVHVELVDLSGASVKEGETGYVCVTGLHNTAMPMLRYRLNDLASMDYSGNCPCGNPNPTIQIKAARMPEFLLLDDLSVYDRAQMYCPINSGMQLFETDAQDIVFNLKMDTLDHYEVLVYQNPRSEADVEKVLREMFLAYGLPNIQFTVHATEKDDPSKPVGVLKLR